MGNHRADRRGPEGAASDPTPVGGTRANAHAGSRSGSRAGSHAGGRRKATRSQASPFHRVPAVPSILGALAIAAAAVGAVGIGGGQLGGSQDLQLSAGAADAFNGTDAFNFTGEDPRMQAISRDADREQLAAQAAQNLKATVNQKSAQRNAELASLAVSAQKRADEIAKNLWVLPTVGYHLTARFGQSSGLWSHNHTGLDFAAPTGTPIFAVANGVISFTGWDGSYGYKTVETLPDGTEIWYAHQSAIEVSVGQKVIQSAEIGKIGSTGNVTGPHVHIEVRPGGGDPVDPYPAFVYHGVTP